MSQSFFALNIPKPNQDLETEILRCAAEAPLDNKVKSHHERLQGENLNIISRQYEKEDVIVISLGKAQYQPYFDEEIFPVVGILTNVHSSEKYACWPPHSDRERIFCMNYYYQEGGQKVTTVFYDRIIDHTPGPGTGRIYQYSELNLFEEVHFAMNQWYGLSVRRAHSIEKVENRRIMFSLSFYDITFDQFKQKYPKYLQQ